ncbi:MAG: hypothetical protein KGN78_04540 [Actinomycetales bacterium]|nr:hypothetical protein [Actinomycetales bacterium]
MKQAGFWFQFVGIVVTMFGLGYAWVQWVRSDPDHPFRRRWRRMVARTRTWLGRARTHQVTTSVSTTWNVAATAEARDFAPEEGLAGRVQALDHRVEDLANSTSREIRDLQDSIQALRGDLYSRTAALQDALATQEVAHLSRTRAVAVGGLGLAAAGVLRSAVGTVMSYAAS